MRYLRIPTRAQSGSTGSWRMGEHDHLPPPHLADRIRKLSDDYSRPTGARTDMTANPVARVLLLAVLELIVGGIVVLGGAALVYFSTDSTGTSLGIVHAILGLIAFPTGYLLLTGNARARTLTLGVDAAIIAFSTASEIILSTASSLPRGPFADSVIGTAVAVLIAAVIMSQLMCARPRLPAGRPSSVR